MTEKRKNYNIDKKVALGEITSVFLDYINYIDLTRSEYLLIKDVYDNVIDLLCEEE